MESVPLQLEYIGHGSLVISLAEGNWITDPNFSQKILGHKRQRPAARPDPIPELKGILLSSVQRAFFDVFSYKFFSVETPVYMPKEIAPFFHRFLNFPSVELSERNPVSVNGAQLHRLRLPGGNIRLLRRYPVTAYALQSPAGNLYFASQCAYGPHFREAARLKPDIAILPLRSKLETRRKHRALTIAEAAQAMQDLGAKYLLLIAWEAFPAQLQAPEWARREVEEFSQQEKLGERLRLLEPGQRLRLDAHRELHHDHPAQR